MVSTRDNDQEFKKQSLNEPLRNERRLIQAYMEGKRSFYRGHGKPIFEGRDPYLEDSYLQGWIQAYQEHIDTARRIFNSCGIHWGSYAYDKAIINAMDAIDERPPCKVSTDQLR